MSGENVRRRTKNVESLITIITIGLKPYARATLIEAVKRGYVAASELASLVPEEYAGRPERLPQTVTSIRSCLDALGVAVVPDELRPSLERERRGAVDEPPPTATKTTIRRTRVRAKIAVDVEVETGEAADTEEKEPKKESRWEWRRKKKDIFGLYMHEAGRYKLLGDTELKALAMKVAEGNRDNPDWIEARNRIVEHNLRLAVKRAYGFAFTEFAKRGGFDLLDLIQEANLGLLRAAELYDYRLGFRFSTYAYWWMRQRIIRALAESVRPVRIPVHRNQFWWRIRCEIQRFSTRFGCEPRTEELAEILGIPEERVTQELREMLFTPGYVRPMVELDRAIGPSDAHPMDAGAGDDHHGLIADPQTLTPEQALTARAELHRARERLQLTLKLAALALPERETNIFRLRYGLDGSSQPKTLEAIGQQFTITRERVRQILFNEIWPKLSRLGLRKGERWLQQEIVRIQLLQELTDERITL